MSALDVLENIVFWTLIIVIAFMAKDTPGIAFTLLSYMLIYFFIKRIMTGSSGRIIFFSLNLVVLFLFLVYFSLGVTPADVIQGLGRSIAMLPKLLK